MNDEVDDINRRIAYIDHLRGLYRFEQLVGLGVILLGAVVVVAASLVKTLPPFVVVIGFALLAAGWVAAIYVIWKRTAWRKANPFETWRP